MNDYGLHVHNCDDPHNVIDCSDSGRPNHGAGGSWGTAMLIGEWVNWYQAGNASPGTVGLRRYWLERFAQDYPDLLAVSERDIIDWLGRHAWGSETRKAAVSSLKSFYTWAEEREIVDRSPLKRMRPVKTQKKLPRPISEADLELALSRAKGETRLMLLLGAYAGLRASEIASVHARDVDRNGSVLRVLGKGNKVRTVPIHPKLAPWLPTSGWAFASTARPGEHVTRYYIGNRLRQVLPSPWTAHSLRHRFATMVYQASQDIRAVQELLGHESIRTTEIYVKVDANRLGDVVRLVA